MFYNIHDESLFVRKARKLRQRIKKHFEDNVSPVKHHRDEVYKIEVCVVNDPMERRFTKRTRSIPFSRNTTLRKYFINKKNRSLRAPVFFMFTVPATSRQYARSADSKR